MFISRYNRHYNPRSPYIDGATEEKKNALEARRIRMQWQHISCCLKLGRTGDVYGQILSMFDGTPPEERRQAQQEGYWDRLADVYCALGKAYVIDGVLNSALYSFLQALLEEPGHVEADQAVDQLEARVKSGSNPEDVMVRLNIECMFEEVRHQFPGQQSRTLAQRKRLLKGFRATYREIKSLLHGTRWCRVCAIRILAHSRFQV